jgi:hypothetical protein
MFVALLMFARLLVFVVLFMFVGLLMFVALLKSHDFLIMCCSLLKRLMISECELANVNVGFFMNTGKPFLHTKQFATSCSFPRRWSPHSPNYNIDGRQHT